VRRLFLLAFIWGWSFLFIKVILEDAPPTFLAWGRIALGLAVLAVALLRSGESLPERRYWGHLLGRGAHQLGPGLGPERLHAPVRGRVRGRPAR